MRAALKSFLDYLIGIGDAFSKLGNAFLPGSVTNESISARAFRQHEESVVWKLVYDGVNGFFFWQENHCRKVFENDQKRNLSAVAQGAEHVREILEVADGKHRPQPDAGSPEQA